MTEDFSMENNQSTPQIVINNSNQNGGGYYGGPEPKNKWIALLFWLFLGVVGGHKFYEGRIGMGILYIFTVGLFGIGWLIDFWVLLFKRNPYYV